MVLRIRRYQLPNVVVVAIFKPNIRLSRFSPCFDPTSPDIVPFLPFCNT